MARRILDNVSITALSKHGDDKLTRSVIDMFGEGTEVREAKTTPVYFEKSKFGLQGLTLGNILRKFAKEFKPDSSICELIDQDNVSHNIPSAALSIINGMLFYSVQCHPSISRCITDILKEIEHYYRTGTYVESVTLTAEEDGTTSSNTNHLLKYCRSEVLDLLSEVGVGIV